MNKKNKENLKQLLQAKDGGHFDQAIELCRMAALSSDTVLDLLNFHVELVSIPGGANKIGEKDKRETVDFDPFEIAATMTTVAQWAAIMGWVYKDNGRQEVSEEDARDQRPVVNITAIEAEEFCRRLTTIFGLDGQDVEVRLPHSAEWEHAAQGGESYEYAGSDDPDEVAWYAANSDYQLKPVGLKKPNGFGLYDMSGNAYCWTCTDWSAEDPSGAKAYRAAKEVGADEEKA